MAMPDYTCATVESTLAADVKADPAGIHSRPALEIAAVATRITGMPANRVMVVFESSPAHYAVEAGRILPAPGEEAAWLAAGSVSQP
jgi:hypothetical protein